MDSARDGERSFSALQTARAAGISKNTLLRWLKRGKVPEVARDRNGWRIFTAADVAAVTAFARKTTPPPAASGLRDTAEASAGEAA